jgi:Uri superfamily endonuclease
LTQLENQSGTYVVMLYVEKRRNLVVGRLGTMEFVRGWYAYVGSAFGPGGLRARIRRHVKQTKKKHWHVDYLREHAVVKAIWTTTHPQRLEHQWAALLSADPFNGKPVAGFGSTDCHCRSHLFYFKRRPDERLVRRCLQARVAAPEGIKSL